MMLKETPKYITRPTILSAALLSLLSLLTVGAAPMSTAQAEEGIRPIKNKTIKVKNFTLIHIENSGKESIVCREASGEGSFESAQHGTATLTLTECSAFGALEFPAMTLGANPSTIKLNVLLLVCLANSGALEFALLIQPTETVHVEVPIVKALLLVKGTVIAKAVIILFENRELGLTLEGSGGKQKRDIECEINGKRFKHSLEMSTDTKADIAASMETKLEIRFAEEIAMNDM